MALLHAAALARERLPSFPTVHAVTIDHALRTESAAEAAFVARTAAALGVPHETIQLDWDRPTSGVQASARSARLATLRRVLLRDAPDPDRATILTAHTADDDAETVAMRLQRSADGAAGIATWCWLQPGWLYRPFLALDGATLRDWLSARDATWSDDPSNEDERFERVRVRVALRGRKDEKRRLLIAGANGRYRRRKEGFFAGRAFPLTTCVHPNGKGAILYFFARLDWRSDVTLLALRAVCAFVGALTHLPSAEAARRLREMQATRRHGNASLGRCVVSWNRWDYRVRLDPRNAFGTASRRTVDSSWGERLRDDRWLAGERAGFHRELEEHDERSDRAADHVGGRDADRRRRIIHPWVEMVPEPDWELAHALAAHALRRDIPSAPLRENRWRRVQPD